MGQFVEQNSVWEEIVSVTIEYTMTGTRLRNIMA